MTSSSLHPINLSMLDGLVKRFLAHYGVKEAVLHLQSSRKTHVLSEAEEHAARIREHAVNTDIPAAISAAQSMYPDILQYVCSTSEAMELHLQHAVELLTCGQEEAALAYIHNHPHLQPSAAWDASLYRHFKDRLSNALLEGSMTGTKDWSEGRHRAACVLIDAMHRVHHQNHSCNGSSDQTYPDLGMIIRYLVTVHNLHHVFSGTETLCPDIDHFLLPGRLPPTETETQPSTASTSINNTVVRQLTDVLSIPHDEAVATLQRCSGDSSAAIRAELRRMQLNTAHILPLALEYARDRGFLAYQDNKEHNNAHEKKTDADTTYYINNTKQIMSQVRNALSHGHYRQCLNLIQDTKPGALDDVPRLRYMLQALCMAEAAKAGDTDEALQIAEQELWQQASDARERDLLRDVSLVLVDPSATVPVDEEDVAGRVCTLIGSREESEDNSDVPTLQKCLQHLLYTHNEWFRRQLCKDPFEHVFDIPTLKNPLDEDRYQYHQDESKQDVSSNTHEMETDDAAQDTAASRDSDGEDGSSAISEESISMLLEIVPVSRPEAVMLLEQHDGDLQQVLESLFS